MKLKFISYFVLILWPYFFLFPFVLKILEPGNDFGGDSNKIIKKGPDQGKPDLLWAKAQDMFRQEYGGLEGEGGADWDKLDDRGKMNFVKSNETVQKKFFNM